MKENRRLKYTISFREPLPYASQQKALDAYLMGIQSSSRLFSWAYFQHKVYGQSAEIFTNLLFNVDDLLRDITNVTGGKPMVFLDYLDEPIKRHGPQVE